MPAELPCAPPPPLLAASRASAVCHRGWVEVELRWSLKFELLQLTCPVRG